MKRVAIVLLLAASIAQAAPVTVKVIEIAGGLAYLDQGSTAGIQRGAKVTIAGRVFIVVEVTEKSAVIELGSAAVAVGASGTAEVTAQKTEGKTLEKPRPPDAFRDQWPDPTPPALAQKPVHVPLGSGKARGRSSVTLIGHGLAVGDRKRVDASAEARLIASFEMMNSGPLAVDVDVSGRAYREGADKLSRVPFFARTAQLRYGSAADPRLALGRLRFAASAVGMLDGARASARFSRFEAAAFGGIVPDPISGKPDTSAARFGAEVAYDDPAHAWRPRASITAYGSTWEGELDERRLVASAQVSRAAWWADGWAEAQAFSSDNPWKAKSVEIVGAGTTVQWRRRGTHVGADVTYLRPERSLRLAAALPPSWLCTLRPQTGDVVEACDPVDSWTSGALFAGMRGGAWSVDAIGTVGRTNGRDTTYDTSGFLGAEYRFGVRRILAAVSASRAGFVQSTAAQIGVGAALSRNLDATLSYRPELLDYVAATEPFLLHTGVLDVHWAIRGDLDLALSGMGTTGTDRDAMAVLTTIVWRPL